MGGRRCASDVMGVSDFVEVREGHFAAGTLRVLFGDVSPEEFFSFSKEISVFGKV